MRISVSVPKTGEAGLSTLSTGRQCHRALATQIKEMSLDSVIFIANELLELYVMYNV